MKFSAALSTAASAGAVASLATTAVGGLLTVPITIACSLLGKTIFSQDSEAATSERVSEVSKSVTEGLRQRQTEQRKALDEAFGRWRNSDEGVSSFRRWRVSVNVAESKETRGGPDEYFGVVEQALRKITRTYEKWVRQAFVEKSKSYWVFLRMLPLRQRLSQMREMVVDSLRRRGKMSDENVEGDLTSAGALCADRFTMKTSERESLRLWLRICKEIRGLPPSLCRELQSVNRDFEHLLDSGDRLAASTLAAIKVIVLTASVGGAILFAGSHLWKRLIPAKGPVHRLIARIHDSVSVKDAAASGDSETRVGDFLTRLEEQCVDRFKEGGIGNTTFHGEEGVVDIGHVEAHMRERGFLDEAVKASAVSNATYRPLGTKADAVRDPLVTKESLATERSISLLAPLKFIWRNTSSTSCITSAMFVFVAVCLARNFDKEVLKMENKTDKQVHQSQMRQNASRGCKDIMCPRPFSSPLRNSAPESKSTIMSFGTGGIYADLAAKHGHLFD
jgi:hypothetical protein